MATYLQIYDAFEGSSGVRNRMFVALARYAVYVAGGGGAPSAARLAWAKDALLNTAAWVDRTRTAMMGDPQLIADGAAITDANLQTAVETALAKIIPA